MSCINSNASQGIDQAALLLSLANIEQAAKRAAKALLAADDQDGNTNALEGLLRGIQRKADALRLICGGVQ